MLRLRRPLFALAAAPLTTAWVRCDEAKPDFRKVTCVKNTFHTHNTRQIEFAIPEGWPDTTQPVVNVLVRTGNAGQEASCCACCKCSPCGCPKGPNGCCGCCKCPNKCGCPKKDLAGGAVVRPYNPIEVSVDSKGRPVGLTLLVKRYGDNAKMGSALHSLTPGDTVDMKGPNQQFMLSAGKHSQIGFIAGGTGITPIIQAVRHILQHDTAKVTLITLNESTSDILLRKEIDELQRSFAGRLDVTHVVEYGTTTEGVVAVHGELGSSSTTSMKKGRPSIEVLSALPAPADGVMVMVCGRPPMTAAIAGKKIQGPDQGPVEGILKELGYGADQVWRI